jgi:hypothetical protein
VEVELLRRCDGTVGKLGLFSPNETKEDVSTADLKYLLVCPLSARPPPLTLFCSPYKFMEQGVIIRWH